MHELYELKETLCDELKEYSRKGKMSAGDLEVVDKLTHTIKNLDKIIEAYEEADYSEARRGSRGSYEGGRSYNNGMMYDDGRNYRIEGSYARGRRNARRDSMGRYSRDDGMIMELRELMEEAPDERTKMEFERFIRKMESMEK